MRVPHIHAKCSLEIQPGAWQAALTKIHMMYADYDIRPRDTANNLVSGLHSQVAHGMWLRRCVAVNVNVSQPCPTVAILAMFNV